MTLSALQHKSESKASILGDLPPSAKIFLSLMLCVAGLCYLSLLASIWLDTEFKMEYIVEGYASMGAIELVQHSFKYLFWFFGIFGLVGGVFLLSDASENVKKVFSAAIPTLIVTDMGSAWLMSHSSVFGSVMEFSGLILAASFLFMFVKIQLSIWIPKS